MIGYMAGTIRNEAGHYLIISMADGAVQHSYASEDALCSALNEYGMLPIELMALTKYND